MNIILFIGVTIKHSLKSRVSGGTGKPNLPFKLNRGGFEPGFSRGMKYQALYLSDIQVFVYCPELK